jgi:hypothetical protein
VLSLPLPRSAIIIFFPVIGCLTGFAPVAHAQFNCVAGFFCPAGKMYDPIGLCVDPRECSVEAPELPPGIALGRCEETRGMAGGLPMADETD